MTAALVVAACLLMLGLTVVPGEQNAGLGHVGGTDELSVAWLPGPGCLRVVGTGFRPNSRVLVRVGSAATVEATVDATSTARVDVPLDPRATGVEGSSVIVTGRARTGSAKTLVAASPPVAAGHGPADVMPWSVGGAVVVALLAAVPRRRATGLNDQPGMEELG